MKRSQESALSLLAIIAVVIWQCGIWGAVALALGAAAGMWIEAYISREQ